MWGLLATSHAPINANDNLGNKSYFCLGLLTKLADLLIPVDARPIIFGIFDPFPPLKMASHWDSGMIFDQTNVL